jgi:hypothetical protein
MKPNLPRLLLLISLLPSLVAPGLAAAGSKPAPLPVGQAPAETWRITRDRAAPWPGPGEVPSRVGKTWRIGGPKPVGETPLGCSGAGYEFVLSPAEGLFEGGLPAPAAESAAALDIHSLPLVTQRISCNTGSFDLHRYAQDRAAFGLDGRVLYFQRESVETTPLAAAMEVLILHFSGDMGFSRESVARKAEWLTPDLRDKLLAWLALPQNPDEVPAINGDPFTNSQEYPDTFRLRSKSSSAATAEVNAIFSDGHRNWRVTLLMRKAGERWLLDDLRYEDGATLRQLL